MNNIGIFIDSENISHADLPYIMTEIKNMGRIIVTRIYADWTSPATENWKQYIISYALEPIHCPKIPRKNSVDIKLIDDIYDILYFKQTVDTYVLVSNDVDYATAARKIKLFGKTLVTFGYNNCSEMLKNISDKFINISLLHFEKDKKEEQEIIHEQEIIPETEQIEVDNVFEANMDDEENITKKTGDHLADIIFEIMNNEKHLNMSTLKHRIKKKYQTENLESTIKNKYRNYFRIISSTGKKKKIYDITAMHSDVHKTIDEQFLSVFHLADTNEIVLSQFREKISLLINNFDHRMWGFSGFKEMITTLFFGTFDIEEKGNYQYIDNLTA